MTRVERMKAITKGVAVALLRRAIYITLGLVVLQLLTLQFTVDTSGSRQEQEAQKRLQKALDENKKEHQKTQRYLRCIVLLPVNQRTEANFAKCGETGQVEPVINGGISNPPVVAQSSGDTARTQQATTGSPPDSTAAPTMSPAPARANQDTPTPPSRQPAPLIDLSPLLQNVKASERALVNGGLL